MRLRLLLPLACLLPAAPLAILSACGEDTAAIPPPDDDGGGDANATDGPSGTDDGQAIDAVTPAPDVVCPTVAPDDGAGAFVAVAGSTSATCGSRAEPCRTIALGIARAKAANKVNVYVSRGVYVEHVTLDKGLRIEGGYDVLPTGAWNRTCVDASAAVVVRAPPLQRVTVAANDLGGKATLAFLRIESSAQADIAAGESIYGVAARGTTTSLELDEVHVVVANGGAGDPGAPGAPGPDGGATGCTPASAGGNGAAGSDGAGATAGTFTDPGYTPASGAGGTTGTGGEDGTTGGAGVCVQCGSCNAACVFVGNGTQSCGTEGLPGCGGGPGGHGSGGAGGGSSIGLFAWDATVLVNGGRIRAGDGGNGGAGGAGGAGGKGAAGAMGAASANCVVGCTLSVTNVCTDMMGHGTGGTAGGPGGTGGRGGSGGGGAGGSSIAIYQGGTGVVTTAGGTVLEHGAAGAGGGPAGSTGAAGTAAARVP